jgi:hypothetical protein
MTPITINISWEWALGILGTLILIAWKTNGRFTAIEISLQWISDTLNDLKIDIDNVRARVFQTGSPVTLTDKGAIWLVDSGLKEYIDLNNAFLMEWCAIKKDTNAYEVQEYVFSLFDKLCAA